MVGGTRTWAGMSVAACAGMPSNTSLVVCVAALVPACVTSAPEEDAGAQLSACWVETAHRDVPGFGSATASGLLVKHRDGNVLLDGGNSTRFFEEVEVYEGEDRLFMEAIVGMLAPQMPLPDALRMSGVLPGDLDMFLASHVHVDHVGGLVDLPDVPVLLPASELSVVERGLTETLFEVVPAHARRIAPLAQPLVFDGPAYAGFAASADVLGDGSVVVVPLPGHTPGSIGTFITVGDTRVFHVGDAVSTLAQLEADTGKMFPMNRTDADAEAALATVHVLNDLAAADPDLRIIPAHDRAAWSDVFAQPGSCITQ